MTVVPHRAHIRSTLLCMLVLCHLAAGSAAGQLALMERSEGHRRLDFLLGEWSHEESQTILGEQATVRSESRYAWLPGDVWLRSDVTIRGLPGIDVHHGWLQVTYDESKEEYVQIWIDNQSALLFIARGKWTTDNRLVLDGSYEWQGEIRYQRTVYIPVSEDEFLREFLDSTDGETYSRRSLARNLRRGTFAEPVINRAFDPLEWLIGDWQAQFRPRGEELAAPTMRFEWGDGSRSFLRMTGTQPTEDGGLVPEYESTVIWHPVKGAFVFQGVYKSGAGRVVEDGDIDLLDEGAVRLNMRVHYPEGANLPFSGPGATAGEGGHTLEFRRTFHRAGADGLRGVFRIRRGDQWENPHPELGMGDGYPWKRVD